MKKCTWIIVLITLLFCGCGKKSLNCSLQLNEDGGLTTNAVHYDFNFWGNQTSREEITTVTFDNVEDCNYYYDYISKLYNQNADASLNYNVEKDETTFTVKTSRSIIIKDIDQNSLEDLTPKTNLNEKKIKKYYEEIGFNCN